MMMWYTKEVSLGGHASGGMAVKSPGLKEAATKVASMHWGERDVERWYEEEDRKKRYKQELLQQMREKNDRGSPAAGASASGAARRGAGAAIRDLAPQFAEPELAQPHAPPPGLPPPPPPSFLAPADYAPQYMHGAGSADALQYSTHHGAAAVPGGLTVMPQRTGGGRDGGGGGGVMMGTGRPMWVERGTTGWSNHYPSTHAAHVPPPIPPSVYPAPHPGPSAFPPGSPQAVGLSYDDVPGLEGYAGAVGGDGGAGARRGLAQDGMASPSDSYVSKAEYEAVLAKLSSLESRLSQQDARGSQGGEGSGFGSKRRTRGVTDGASMSGGSSRNQTSRTSRLYTQGRESKAREPKAGRRAAWAR